MMTTMQKVSKLWANLTAFLQNRHSPFLHLTIPRAIAKLEGLIRLFKQLVLLSPVQDRRDQKQHSTPVLIAPNFVFMDKNELERLRQQAQQVPLLEQLLDEAEAETKKLREEVKKWQQKANDLQIQLGFMTLKSGNGNNPSSSVKPKVAIVGGNSKRKQVLDKFENHFTFLSFFSEQTKGHSNDFLKQIQSAVKKADAVIIVTGYSGHDKTERALSLARSSNKPYRIIPDLTETQLRRVLEELFPTQGR